MVFHLLRGVIHRHQPLGAGRIVHERVYIRMGDIPPSVEKAWLSKDNILGVQLIFAFNKANSLKPYQINKTGSIGKMCY